jgi:hypothetical protein
MTEVNKAAEATPPNNIAPAQSSQMSGPDASEIGTDTITSQTTFSNALRWTAIGLAGVLLILSLLWATQTIARHEANATLRNSVGVVDIDQALAAHRANYLEMISKESVTDEQREQAASYVKASTELINEALGIIAHECSCVLLIKPAVLQHQQVGLVDHTARLLELTKSNVTKGR